jgi:hypothetical protein
MVQLAMANIEIIDSSRGGKIVCVNNYMYSLTKTTKENISYYSCKGKCGSSVHVRGDEVLRFKEQHNHPDDEEKINSLKVVKNLRKRAAEEPLVSANKLYR